MDMQDLIRIMVECYQRESDDGKRALQNLSASLDIFAAFMEALELARLDS